MQERKNNKSHKIVHSIEGKVRDGKKQSGDTGKRRLTAKNVHIPGSN